MLNRFIPPKTCLFVQWTQPLCRYLLVERSSGAPHILASGVFETEDDKSVAEQLQAQLTAQEIRCRHAVLLLPQAALEVSSHHLPPATEDELPQLIDNALAAEMDDQPRVSDFLVTHQDSAGCETLVFSLENATLDGFTADFKKIGLKLLGVTFSGLGAVEYLQQVIHRPPATAVIVSVGDDVVDLTVTGNGRPILFRSIPCSSEEDRVRAERLGAEIRRTLALAHRGDDDSMRLYLLGSADEHEQFAQLLSHQFSTSVVNPLDHVRSATDVTPASRYTNLLGVACAWLGSGLDLDLLHPRSSPQAPSRLRRVALWGGIAAAILLFFGYAAWEDRADQLAEIAKQKSKLKTLEKRANKAQQLQDVASAVRSWRRDDIAWLDELRELSDRLPDGEQALIRRMSMSTDSQGNGIIDLAVQVSRQEVFAALQDALRDERHSVSSKRVTQSDGEAKMSWAFETRITFTPTVLPELPRADEGDESP